MAQGVRMTHLRVVRVAMYSRVSTKDKGQDFRNQTDQLREFCQRVFIDIENARL